MLRPLPHPTRTGFPRGAGASRKIGTVFVRPAFQPPPPPAAPCFLQLNPRIKHWRVVVITPHRHFNLGLFTPPGDLQAWFDDHSAG
jgi:hypothetical protein